MVTNDHGRRKHDIFVHALPAASTANVATCIGTLDNRSPSTNFSFFSRLYFPASAQAVVKGVVPFPPPGSSLLLYCTKGSAIPLLVGFHRVLLTHAFALSARQFADENKSRHVECHDMPRYITGTRVGSRGVPRLPLTLPPKHALKPHHVDIDIYATVRKGRENSNCSQRP